MGELCPPGIITLESLAPPPEVWALSADGELSKAPPTVWKWHEPQPEETVHVWQARMGDGDEWETVLSEWQPTFHRVIWSHVMTILDELTLAGQIEMLEEKLALSAQCLEEQSSAFILSNCF